MSGEKMIKPPTEQTITVKTFMLISFLLHLVAKAQPNPGC
jgi:hypothetical protein